VSKRAAGSTALREADSDLMTVEDFYALVADGVKADLLDGVIYMASPDTRTNDRLTGFLSRLLGGYCEATGAGEVFGSRFAFVLSPHRAPEPDVAFVHRRRLHLVGERDMRGAPDVAIEVVSRDSRTRDHVEKKALYEQVGVREYWLIDPVQKRAEFYRLRGRRYELVALEANRLFRSEAIEKFYLDVEWLFATPPAKASEKLGQILAAGKRPRRTKP
jgi:Uma2 family endonuclease